MKKNDSISWIKRLKYLRKSISVFFVLPLFIITVLLSCGTEPDKPVVVQSAEEAPWRGWNKYQIKPEDTLVRYGRELIENTSYYFGPKGTVAPITNLMAVPYHGLIITVQWFQPIQNFATEADPWKPFLSV
jgi:hypothetical protein